LAVTVERAGSRGAPQTPSFRKPRRMAPAADGGKGLPPYGGPWRHRRSAFPCRRPRHDVTPVDCAAPEWRQGIAALRRVAPGAEWPQVRRSAFPCRRRWHDTTPVVRAAPETAQPPQCRHPGNRAAVIRDPHGARATHGGWCQFRPRWIPGLRCAPPGMTGLMGMPSSRKPRSGDPGSSRQVMSAHQLFQTSSQESA
jgi:hypothetical protein